MIGEFRRPSPEEIGFTTTGGEERLEIHKSVANALMLAGRTGDKFHLVLVDTIRTAIKAGVPNAIDALDPDSIKNRNLSEQAKRNLTKAWDEVDANMERQ